MCLGGCIQKDAEHEFFACILFHYQCGVCPIKCLAYDHNNFCWGCVCCRYQIDPCALPRKALEGCCAIVPCGCIGANLIETVCCCNPGTPELGADDQQKMAELNKQKVGTSAP